ncbi:MAG: hypothetical protein DRP84_05025 [Spirochaetes bacterium]|nr:MAG: hypothetical protein DRP84_05025 [Spirochaetota bacterium]
MLLIIAVSVTVIGLLVLVATVISYSGQVKNEIDRDDMEVGIPYNNTKSANTLIENEKKYGMEEYYNQGPGDKSEQKEFLPVLNKNIPIEGLEKELIHFEGKGIFYQIENEKDISELNTGDLEKIPSDKIEGNIYLTSKWIILAGDKVKKIAIKSIEDYRFVDDLFLIKRKRVKKRKDIFKVIKDPAEFYYIIRVLLKK